MHNIVSERSWIILSDMKGHRSISNTTLYSNHVTKWLHSQLIPTTEHHPRSSFMEQKQPWENRTCEDSIWPQIYRNGMRNTTWLTDWRLYLVPECTVLHDAGGMAGWPLKPLHGLQLCSYRKGRKYIHCCIIEDYMVLECALLQKRREIYNTDDSCEILQSQKR